MDTVNISIPETEKIMVYAPNYFRRLNHTLAKYTKRSVFNGTRWLFLGKTLKFIFSGGPGKGGGVTACNENPLSLHRDLQNYMVWRFVMSMVTSLSGSYKDTRKEFRKVRCPDPDKNLQSADQQRMISIFARPKINRLNKKIHFRLAATMKQQSEVNTSVATSLSFVYAVDVALETNNRKLVSHKLHSPVG